MTAKAETIQAHIERSAARKAIYARRLAGETNGEIARDLGLSVYRVSNDVGHWRDTLGRYAAYREGNPRWSERLCRHLDRYFQPLIAAGLLDAGFVNDGNPRSPEYGYA